MRLAVIIDKIEHGIIMHKIGKYAKPIPKIEINLHKTEPDNNGMIKYIGINNITITGKNTWYGNCEIMGNSPEEFFENIKSAYKNYFIVIKSEELPQKMKNIDWFKGRLIIQKEDLIKMVASQGRRGLNYLSVK